MNKVIKRIAMLFMVCGLAVSVSFGVDLVGNEENHEKLKAELEMWDLVDFEKRCYTRDLKYIKNVIAFFDEIRAKEVKVESCKKRYWARNCYLVDKFNIAVEEVREMPRFKKDSGIYNYKWGNKENWWKDVFNKLDFTKIELESCGAKKEYWEAVKRESE